MSRLSVAAKPAVRITEDDFETLTHLLDAAPGMPGADLLGQELGRASVVPVARSAKLVRLGSRVTYRDLDREVTRTVELALPRDASIDDDRISVLTPIGAALIGLSVGDRFGWIAAGKPRRIEVLAVS